MTGCANSVSPNRIYLDHGLTGTHRTDPASIRRSRPSEKATPSWRPDSTGSPDPCARAIGDDLAGRGITLSLGGQVYDPTDPMGKMFFNILATFAEFEVDLLRMRTREGMAVARAKGKRRGKKPKLSRNSSANSADGRHRRLHDRRPHRALFRLPRDRLPDPAASPGCRQGQVTSPSRYLAVREHRTRTADPGLRPITVTWP